MKTNSPNNHDAELMRDAQYRKGMSIAFFNATNSAISLVSAKAKKTDKLTALVEDVKLVRDMFLKEYDTYYASTISKIGSNQIDPTIAIDTITSASSMDELRKIWRALSEEERQNEEVISSLKKQKQLYAEKTSHVPTVPGVA